MADFELRSVVMSLNYYAPYVSGLTEAARLVAERLVERGVRVTVVTTRHDPSLPRRETIAGVHVVRTRVIGRIGKGVLSPTLPIVAARLARRADVLNLHLPMIESGLIAWLVARHVAIVPTYQCDVTLPSGMLNTVQRIVMDLSCRAAIRISGRAVPSSADYAEHSRLAGVFSAVSTTPISPPTVLRDGGAPSFRDGAGFHLGFMGRLVEEKGVPYLVRAFSRIDDPDARLLIAGDYAGIAGGSVIDQIRTAIAGDARIRILGFLPDGSIPDFFASLDAFALPSVNALEAFGIVQVEALRLGIPVVASDMPGVRIPVGRVGLGAIARPRDEADLARAIADVRSLTAAQRASGARRAGELYSLDATVEQYRTLFVTAAAQQRAGTLER